MSNRQVLVVAVMMWAVCGMSAFRVFAADMFSGNWKENISKSTYPPGTTPKQPTIQKVDASDGLKVQRDFVLANGQRGHVEYTLKFDAKDYALTATLEGAPVPDPNTISAKKIDDFTIEFTVKNQGKITTTGKWVVSKDGKTLTWTQTPGGRPETYRYIYEKQ